MAHVSPYRRFAGKVLSLLPRQRAVQLLDVIARELSIVGMVANGANGTLEGDSRDHGVFRPYVATGEYSSELLDLVRTGLRETGGTYIDVGANIGATLIPIARLENVKCFGIEAEPGNFGRLRRNLDRNNIECATIFDVAVGPAPGTARFWISDNNLGDGRLQLGAAELNGGSYHDVRVERADTLIESVIDIEELPRPIFIKIDIQGAEPGFVAGAERLLERVDHYFSEVWPASMSANGYDWHDYLRMVFSRFGKVDVYRHGKLIFADANLEACTEWLATGSKEDPEFYCDVYARGRRVSGANE